MASSLKRLTWHRLAWNRSLPVNILQLTNMEVAHGPLHITINPLRTMATGAFRFHPRVYSDDRSDDHPASPIAGGPPRSLDRLLRADEGAFEAEDGRRKRRDPTAIQGKELPKGIHHEHLGVEQSLGIWRWKCMQPILSLVFVQSRMDLQFKPQFS